MNLLSTAELLEKLRLCDESVEIEAKPGSVVYVSMTRPVSWRRCARLA